MALIDGAVWVFAQIVRALTAASLPCARLVRFTLSPNTLTGEVRALKWIAYGIVNGLIFAILFQRGTDEILLVIFTVFHFLILVAGA